MRVLVLANIGLGLYKFRRELLECLVKENEVYFCIPEDEYVERIQMIGCNFISCTCLERRSMNPFKDLKLIGFYKKIINEIKPNVILTYTIKPNVYGGVVCGAKRIPYISNITGLGTTIENGGILALISMMLYRIGLKRAQCVFFQNEDNLNYFVKKKITKVKTRLIPGSGVNLSAHCFEPYPPEAEGTRFLFVGRIMKDKGIEELLTAIRMIRQEKKDVVLDVVGFCDEDYTTALREAEKENAIVYHGIQTDVHSFYKKCHCVVLPSYHEGMANVLLEASSTGRPVIATRVPGCQETFEEGITGYGCEAKNSESLIAAMKRFLATPQDEREKMGFAARKKMEREY